MNVEISCSSPALDRAFRSSDRERGSRSGCRPSRSQATGSNSRERSTFASRAGPPRPGTRAVGFVGTHNASLYPVNRNVESNRDRSRSPPPVRQPRNRPCCRPTPRRQSHVAVRRSGPPRRRRQPRSQARPGAAPMALVPPPKSRLRGRPRPPGPRSTARLATRPRSSSCGPSSWHRSTSTTRPPISGGSSAPSIWPSRPTARRCGRRASRT